VLNRKRTCRRCSQEFPAPEFHKGYGPSGYPLFRRYCTTCQAEIDALPAQPGPPKRGYTDYLALAEKTLYPGTPYRRMTKAQRDACIVWAREECRRLQLLGFVGWRAEKNAEEEAA
jgi:hypothetical protein